MRRDMNMDMVKVERRRRRRRKRRSMNMDMNMVTAAAVTVIRFLSLTPSLSKVRVFIFPRVVSGSVTAAEIGGIKKKEKKKGSLSTSMFCLVCVMYAGSECKTRLYIIIRIIIINLYSSLPFFLFYYDCYIQFLNFDCQIFIYSLFLFLNISSPSS